MYLGSLLTWDKDCRRKSRGGIAPATEAMVGFKKVWNSMHVSTRTKLSIKRTCMTSVPLYACKTWTLKKRDIDSLVAFEMKNSPHTLAAENNEFIENTKA